MNTLLLLVTTIILAGSLANAAAPEVACDLSYHKTDAMGFPVVSERLGLVDISESGSEIRFKTFQFKGSLNQICASGFGAPCSGAYDLKITINSRKSTNHLSVPVGNKNDRYSTSLQDSKESLSANCDVK